MVQLNILSGKMAGTVCVARHFPFRVGRNAQANLQLEEPGVWDNHLELNFLPGQGIHLATQAEALVTLNGERVREALLRNGDQLEIGALKIRFWLTEIQPRSQTLREWLTWIAFAALFLGQVAVIYWLLQ